MRVERVAGGGEDGAAIDDAEGAVYAQADVCRVLSAITPDGGAVTTLRETAQAACRIARTVAGFCRVYCAATRQARARN